MNGKSCATCGACHFGPVPGQKVKGYQCRRHPPAIVVLPAPGTLAGQVAINVTALWPVIALDDEAFCHDWIQKADAFVGARDAGLN